MFAIYESIIAVNTGKDIYHVHGTILDSGNLLAFNLKPIMHRNKIGGTVTVDGVPARRAVVALNRLTFAYIGSTFSDPITGDWQIHGLPEFPERSLLVMVQDNTGEYNAEVMDYISQVRTVDVVESPWTPAAVATSLWLDSTDLSTITSDVNGVSEWRDKSGGSHHGTQTTQSRRPSFAESTGMTFDEDDEAFFITNPVNSTNLSIFMVLKPHISRTCYLVLGAGSTSFYGICGEQNSGSAMASYTPVSTRHNGEVKSWTSRGDLWTGLSGGEFSIYGITGVSLSGWPEFKLSDYSYQSYPIYSYRGDIKEVIIIPNADAETVYLVEGYLAWKYDMVSKLPGNHPYKNFQPVQLVLA